MSDEEADALCASLRDELIRTVSHTGGHLASNLGCVEITVALHRVFDTSRDRLIFDVGHQCYCHKILTGRGDAMETLRAFGGLSGYPKPCESIHDAFIAGHASNSVSVAVGMAKARTLAHEDYNVIALLGDGALTGGLAYEGLSYAGQSGEKLIVVLNDNGMSISKSVGGVADHLARQRTKPQYLTLKKWYRKIMVKTAFGKRVYRRLHRLKTAIKKSIFPCSMFEDMGFSYLGPVDGHDIRALTRMLQYAKGCKEPVVLHVKTVKGKGYWPAEQNPDAFHGVGAFDVALGTPLKACGENFSSVFGQTLCDLAEEDSRVCAITAAMQDGTGLSEFAEKFPQRYMDVGIAEGHAAAMAAGMAKQGLVPVFAVYSSFLQRGYDMLIHDVAIQNLHVVFCVERAGLVGEDGETHHGLFDVAYLDTVPNMTVLAPSSFQELRRMLRWAVEECPGPVAVRYPRGGEGDWRGDWTGTAARVLRTGSDLTLTGYGTRVNDLLKAAKLLQGAGIEAEVVKLDRLTPIDPQLVLNSVKKTGRLLTAEDVTEANCVGQRLSAALACSGIPVKSITLCNTGRRFVPQGTVPELLRFCGLDAQSIFKKGKEACADGKEAT